MYSSSDRGRSPASYCASSSDGREVTKRSVTGRRPSRAARTARGQGPCASPELERCSSTERRRGGPPARRAGRHHRRQIPPSRRRPHAPRPILESRSRCSRGRNANRDITGEAQGLDLPREQIVEAEVIADRGERRRIGGQGDGRHRPPLPALAVVPDDELGGDVLSRGGGAAVAEAAAAYDRTAAPAHTRRRVEGTPRPSILAYARRRPCVRRFRPRDIRRRSRWWSCRCARAYRISSRSAVRTACSKEAFGLAVTVASMAFSACCR